MVKKGVKARVVYQDNKEDLEKKELLDCQGKMVQMEDQGKKGFLEFQAFQEGLD